MTLAEQEKRVELLEKLVSDQALPAPKRNAKWWLDHAGQNRWLLLRPCLVRVQVNSQETPSKIENRTLTVNRQTEFPGDSS
jgi:hypothetical protein